MGIDTRAVPAIAKHEYGVELKNDILQEEFDAVILAVAHDEFRNLDINSSYQWHACCV